MASFNPEKFQFLSPDADDWNDLVTHFDWLNQENCIYGVLLYPKKGISKKLIETGAEDWIGEQGSFGAGSIDIIVEDRGKDWAVIYRIAAWYDHFNLREQCE